MSTTKWILQVLGVQVARVDVLESGPEWGDFRLHGCWDGEGETPRETVNLATWGRNSGRSGACGEGGPRVVPEGSGFQDFRNSVFQKADAQKFSVSGKKRPN